MQTEYFPLVNLEGVVVGKATRKECHNGSFLLHPVVHLHVFNSTGMLYLQKRSMSKDIQPGKWDTSVGGHVDFGEKVADALKREACEELGLEHFDPIFAFAYPFRSNCEYELVNSYYLVYDGVIKPDPVEIEESRFWSLSEIELGISKHLFTPNFELEFQKLKNIL